MTIGIAATGPNAGLAIVEALEAVEKIATGAIGGFVSLVAIGLDGQMHRAETQRGGTRGLGGPAALSEAIRTARFAGLISSGPDRPDPLSQFTPARAGVGLVTGHRFPSTPGPEGRPLNEMVLDLMAAGRSPQEAVDTVVQANGQMDAGLIALSLDGAIYGADTAYVVGMPRRGAVTLLSDDGTAAVSVLHNSIVPWRATAALAADVAMAVLSLGPPAHDAMTVRTGLPIRRTHFNAWEIDGAGQATAVHLGPGWPQSGTFAFGLGPLAPVLSGPVRRGTALDEPFLLAAGGQLQFVGGVTEARIPVRYA